MLKYVLPLLLISQTALAQVSQSTVVVTLQECGHPDFMFQNSFSFDEDPLFGGNTMLFDVNRDPYWGTALFTVNQTNGFWTLYTFYGENLVCITASGNAFTPF